MRQRPEAADSAVFELWTGAGLLILKLPVHGREAVMEEAAALRAVSAIDVATPRPVAIDPHGVWFGAPGLLMTRLPGEPVLRPASVLAWLDQIATTLTAIHGGHTTAELPVSPRSLWRRAIDGRAPTGLLGPAAADLIATALPDLVRSVSHVAGHGDLHPGNILFTGATASGVVDWRHATVEPREAGVAFLRGELAIYPGGSAPDCFLEAYHRHAGRPLRGLAIWDALYATRGLEYAAVWAASYRSNGVQLSDGLVERRARSWARLSTERLLS